MRVSFSDVAADAELPLLKFRDKGGGKCSQGEIIRDGTQTRISDNDTKAVADALKAVRVPESFRDVCAQPLDAAGTRWWVERFFPCLEGCGRLRQARCTSVLKDRFQYLQSKADLAVQNETLPSSVRDGGHVVRACDFALWMAQEEELEDDPWVRQLMVYFYIYKRKATPASEATGSTEALLRGGENERVEFKSTARWDLNEGKANKEMELAVVQEVAAFMNTKGGVLLVGVEDDGTVIGLENDFKVFKTRKDPDAYERWIMQHLLNAFGQHRAPLLGVTFPKVDGIEICRVDVSPSPAPVYVKSGNEEHFYIRAGKSKKPLSMRETVEYTKDHWPR